MYRAADFGGLQVDGVIDLVIGLVTNRRQSSVYAYANDTVVVHHAKPHSRMSFLQLTPQLVGTIAAQRWIVEMRTDLRPVKQQRLQRHIGVTFKAAVKFAEQTAYLLEAQRRYRMV